MFVQEPRKVVDRYAVGDGAGEEGEAGKAFVSLNWVLSEDPLDLETELAWGFLDYLLLGTSAAPLRKALNDSGLGEALIGNYNQKSCPINLEVWRLGVRCRIQDLFQLCSG